MTWHEKRVWYKGRRVAVKHSLCKRKNGPRWHIYQSYPPSNVDVYAFRKKGKVLNRPYVDMRRRQVISQLKSQPIYSMGIRSKGSLIRELVKLEGVPGGKLTDSEIDEIVYEYFEE